MRRRRGGRRARRRQGGLARRARFGSRVRARPRAPAQARSPPPRDARQDASAPAAGSVEPLGPLEAAVLLDGAVDVLDGPGAVEGQATSAVREPVDPRALART